MQELSEDIKKYKLRSAMTLLKCAEGSLQLLDGRNRLDAAERAGLSGVDAGGTLVLVD